MKIMVTGHRGYIGSKLFDRLKAMGHEVIGIDLLEDDGDILKNLREDSEGKMCSRWFDFKPEYIFHMACWPRVGYSIENPVKTMENNVLAGSILLKFASKVGSVKRVIYSSSSSVIGDGDGPTSPYALQKLVTEMECKIYSKVYGIDTVGLRYFNVYSKDQLADGAYATAVANWMHFIREGKTPFITGDGSQRRDMVHVDDVVSANIFAMNHTEDFGGRYFDVGTGQNISLSQMKDIVLKYHDIEFEVRPARPGEVMLTKADTVPLKTLGWYHTIPILNGINECFKETKREK